ncbi:hypothetical protein [Alteraurantiacibacter aestuarii]|nr:hypothetical protein [Alteraurantiacibacter aestuarii]
MDLAAYAVAVVMSVISVTVFRMITSIRWAVKLPLAVISALTVTEIIAVGFIYPSIGSTYGIAIMFHLIVISITALVTFGILSQRTHSNDKS